MNKIFILIKKTKGKKGFSLVELLVVFSIIALLSSIVLFALNTARQKGNDASKINALIQVRSALHLYHTDNGSYPASTTFSTSLISGRYITSINPSILYVGLTSSGALCSNAPCQSYHVAIPLNNATNKVLISDKDINDTSINGQVDNCINGSASNPDLCYDLTP